MYVEVIKSKQKQKVYKSVLVRESYREGGKVRHRTIANITRLPDRVIGIIKQCLSPDGTQDHGHRIELGPTREFGASYAFKELALQLGLDRIIYSRKTVWREHVLAMIVGRIVYQGSKLGLINRYKDTALWELFGYKRHERPDVGKACYEPLDQLLRAQPRIQKRLAARHLQDGCLILYDITNVWLEGEYEFSKLAWYGRGKNGKRGYKQVAIGLVTNKDGCPIAIELFRGNTSDQKTVKQQVDRLAKYYKLEEIIFAGDRGMLTPRRIEEVTEKHYKTLTALTHPQMMALLEKRGKGPELFDECNIVELTDPDQPEVRYMLCCNPANRERERAKRTELMAATNAQLEAIARVKRKREKKAVCARVGTVLQKYKVGKFYDWQVDEIGRLTWQINDELVEREKALDGCYVVRSSVDKSLMDARECVESYKRLQHVEKAFRNLKTVSLEMRPFFHKTDNRIRAHAFICMLAYYIQWHASERLKPLFQADAKGEDRQWSWQRVIERLKSISKISCMVEGSHAFDKISNPDQEQQRLLNLLEVKTP